MIFVGEVQASRVKPLLAQEKKRTARLIGDVPIYDIVVGNGEGEVPLAKLERHLTKLPANITVKQMDSLESKLVALGTKLGPAAMPKGPLPRRPSCVASSARPGASSAANPQNVYEELWDADIDPANFRRSLTTGSAGSSHGSAGGRHLRRTDRRARQRQPARSAPARTVPRRHGVAGAASRTSATETGTAGPTKIDRRVHRRHDGGERRPGSRRQSGSMTTPEWRTAQ